MSPNRVPAAAYVIRLAEPGDLDGFLALAKLAGPGFTSLPANKEKLASILATSAAASAGAPGAIMLTMEDIASRTIAGCAAVKRGGEMRAGFANFRTGRDAAGAVRTLEITDEYGDLTEIGGLFVHPSHRSKGVGKALAQSRYLYLATAPESFGARVFAELRGVIDDKGVSPFFDAACKPILGMDFIDADRLCAAGENARLVALLPKTPISTDAFSAEAKAAIGACHKSGAAAHAMLEKEGFRFDGVIDLLDGGALVAADTAELRSLKTSRLTRLRAASSNGMSETFLFATTQLDAFRCVAGLGAVQDADARCTPETFMALQLGDGAVARVLPLGSAVSVRRDAPLTLANAN